MTSVYTLYICKMDVEFNISGQCFCWDAEKALINVFKHGVRFEQACEAFFDPFFQIHDATDDDETREAVVGLTEDWTLLFVVHLLRENETIRIISARPVTREERSVYENN